MTIAWKGLARPLSPARPRGGHGTPGVGPRRRLVEEVLGRAGIAVGGGQPWDIRVHDERFFHRVLARGELGLGESYMDGWWDCPRVDQLLERIVRSNLAAYVQSRRGLWARWWLERLSYLPWDRPFLVGRRHYDLGNDLFAAMLDRRMIYSCAYWEDARDLESAQEAKLELVCRKLDLRPGQTLLDIGCGWGGLARYAAENHGVKVVGVTISRAQHEYGLEACRGLPVELRLQDYRDVAGAFDRVVSIGMFEHVGYSHHRTFMRVAHRALKPGGIALVHTITNPDSRRRMVGSWWERYIFPRGLPPSPAQLGRASEELFVLEDVHNIGPHYDPTLMAWHANFERNWPEISDRYDERFLRMWRFYLLGAAGNFRARGSQVHQLVLTHPGTPQPWIR